MGDFACFEVFTSVKQGKAYKLRATCGLLRDHGLRNHLLAGPGILRVWYRVGIRLQNNAPLGLCLAVAVTSSAKEAPSFGSELRAAAL